MPIIMDEHVRKWLLDTLTSWHQTWDDLVPDEDIGGQPDTLFPIIEKIEAEENPQLTRQEYSEVLFHLWQIHYPEEQQWIEQT